MRAHAGRTALVTLALAEVGAIGGFLVCSLFFIGWAFYSYGIHVLAPQPVLGMALWALLVGVPAGAIALPLLGLGVLRRVPLWRALLLPALGGLAGFAIGVTVSVAPASLPIPLLTMVLGAAGVVTGAVAARVEWPSWTRIVAPARKVVAAITRPGGNR